MVTTFSEIRLFASRVGSLRSILLHLALIAAFGIWFPRLKDLDFLDPQVLGAYICLGVIFAGPATAQLFADGASASFEQVRARVFVGVIYGELAALVLLSAGIATIYYTHRGRFIPTPDWPALAKSALFGLAVSAMVASLAALITVRFSRRAAMICLRLILLGLLVLYFYRGQFLPGVGLLASVACLGMAGIFIELLRRACR